MSVELIVFDCDGVLVDSEALVVDVEAEMLTAAGFAITADEILERFTGLAYSTMMAELAIDFGTPVPEELRPRIEQAALDLFESSLEPVAGIGELLASLGLPRCVASSSELERIYLSLEVCGLDAYFERERIFSAQMVRRGKPAPDLFELVARRTGVDPARCVVIEDSPPGVTAARAAGMNVVGLVAAGHARLGLDDRLRAAGASRVFATTEELSRYLGELG